jgi:hypothetical protein
VRIVAVFFSLFLLLIPRAQSENSTVAEFQERYRSYSPSALVAELVRSHRFNERTAIQNLLRAMPEDKVELSLSTAPKTNDPRNTLLVGRMIDDLRYRRGKLHNETLWELGHQIAKDLVSSDEIDGLRRFADIFISELERRSEEWQARKINLHQAFTRFPNISRDPEARKGQAFIDANTKYEEARNQLNDFYRDILKSRVLAAEGWQRSRSWPHKINSLSPVTIAEYYPSVFEVERTDGLKIHFEDRSYGDILIGFRITHVDGSSKEVAVTPRGQAADIKLPKIYFDVAFTYSPDRQGGYDLDGQLRATAAQEYRSFLQFGAVGGYLVKAFPENRIANGDLDLRNPLTFINFRNELQSQYFDLPSFIGGRIEVKTLRDERKKMAPEQAPAKPETRPVG